MTPLICTKQGVSLIGGAPFDRADLTWALGFAPVVVAADGGADRALSQGVVPRALIGDLDSASRTAQKRVECLHHIAEQESSDFEKALSRIDALFVLAVGFSGAGMAHMLAAMSVMARRVGPPCIMIMPEEICFLAPPRLDLGLPAGARVSLFPMGPARGRSSGLRWPIDDLNFAPAGRVGTSNEATGVISLTIEGPMLVFVPHIAMSSVIAALT